MIFVTVGTHEQPFDRLIKCVDELKRDNKIKENVIIQTGYSNYEPQYCEWQKLYPYQQMLDLVKNARIVITHGGPSSFIMPLQIGKIPVVVPRQKQYDEHVNDHQLKFTKEVAERMNAEPGNKDYGALSLLVQYYCNTSIVRKVPPACFIPRPKVDSIVIRLDKLSEAKVKVDNEKLFFDIIRNSFNMRRKTLWNGVKSIGPAKEKLELAFEKAGVDPKRRGETLSIQEFANLANCINEIL